MRLSDNPIIVRPTLIVGLGGTGVLICQWVEHYIRELLGYVPPFVRFLKLDTDASDEGGPPEGILSDFINLFHYLDVGEVVRDNASYPEFHPHLDWMRGFREDATFADYGCQGIPRLGRLVFFELRETVIHEAVATRFSSLRTSTQQPLDEDGGQFVLASDGAPAVHIASSVCGGTGAGMLIDMAYNLRWWSRESFPKPAEVIGHLLLPDAFRIDPMLRPKLEATACATLDQIEFLSDERRSDMRVRYRSDRSGEDHFRRDTGPFNFLYLLNGQVDMGSGDRRHLVRLISRVIRSMTIEPLSQQVRSDANNKLAEILPQRDPVNNHRQCFSSYGFWCGVPGHKQGSIESRILADLESLNGDQGECRGHYRQAVQKAIAGGGGVTPAAGELLQPTVSFSWDTPGQGTSPQVVASVLQTLRRYLESSFVPMARKEAEKTLSPAAPIGMLLDAAEEMVERDFFNAEQLRPLNQLGACLGAWVEGVETLLGQKQSTPAAGVNSVIADTLAEAKEALEMLQGRVPPLSWTTNDVVPVIDKTIDARWPAIAQALLHEGLIGALKTTARVFRVRKQSLDAITALAWQRKSGGEKAGSNGAEEDEAGGRHDRDFFTTPLCLSLESNGALDIVALRDFRQSLIKPMLFDAALSIRESRNDLADVRAVEDRLTESLAGLSDGMKRFLRDVDSHGWDVFRNGLAPQQSVNDHPYYRSVCDIWRLAEPKIDLSKSRKYAVPLPVAITQQVPDSCVPHLLTHNLEVSLREAGVTEGCKRRTGEWLQILRLSYGFCLESISRYSKYVAATDEYVKRMGFEYADLWLDKNWYVAYQSAAAEWRRQLGQKEQALEKRVYEASAAQVGSFRKVADAVNERLRQQLHLLPDASVSIRLAELHGGTNSRIDLILRDLPLADRDVVQDGVNRCVALVEHLVQSVEEGLTALSGNEQKLSQDVLDTCRDELRRLREDLAMAGEVSG
jgi:hypothetical protein